MTTPFQRHAINGADPAVQAYLAEFGVRETPAQAALRSEAAAHPRAGVQVGPEQAQFLGLLVRLIGARRVVEVGTFCGYSALAMALALPEGGELVTCEVDAGTAAVGQRHWQAAGVAGRIALRLGPALATLDALLAAGEAGRFDLAFIDADKGNIDAYYERCLALVRPGGLLAVDNALWNGAVADAAADDADTVALRALNRKIQGDARADMALLPVGDGMNLVRRR
jgi:predicted O-methyltransferase YrrM